MTCMAAQLDHLQALIARDDLYNPAAAPEPPSAQASIVATPTPRRSRRAGGDWTTTLTAVCVMVWSVVAAEIWMLIR
jgi:hypothetical protein